MASKSLKTEKTRLYIGQSSPISSPEEFTLVGGITDVGAPEASTTEIDDTDLESEAKEFILGLTDNGSITFQMKYWPGDPVHQRIEALRDSKNAINWRVEYSDRKTRKEFSAMVKSYNPSAAVDSIVKGPLVLRITGPVTPTYPS